MALVIARTERASVRKAGVGQAATLSVSETRVVSATVMVARVLDAMACTTLERGLTPAKSAVAITRLAPTAEASPMAVTLLMTVESVAEMEARVAKTSCVVCAQLAVRAIRLLVASSSAAGAMLRKSAET